MMTEKTRRLILRVSDGNESALKVLHLFYRLSFHDTIFERLISQNLVGIRFVKWYYKDMGASYLKSVSYLMESNAPIIVGKDFI